MSIKDERLWRGLECRKKKIFLPHAPNDSSASVFILFIFLFFFACKLYHSTPESVKSSGSLKKVAVIREQSWSYHCCL